jgi:uncharacterized protein (TIGR03083 family)
VSEHLDRYDAVRVRLDDLLRGREGTEQVVCCPGWTVRDVVAHLAGLCEDWVTSNLLGYASDEWTASQVARSEGRTLDEILDAWAVAATAFAALPDDELMGPPSRWAFGDAVSHEADIRTAIAAPPSPDDAVRASLKLAIPRWRAALSDASAPTLLARVPGVRDWWLGTHDDPDAVVVEVDAYDLFRALAGRRSAAQVASWSWSADPAPFIAAGIGFPFAWAATDIVDVPT